MSSPQHSAPHDDEIHPVRSRSRTVLLAVFGVALVMVPMLLNLGIYSRGGDPGTAALAWGLAIMWVLAIAALLFAHFARLSIGLSRPDRRGWIVAIVVGVALMLMVPLLSMLAAILVPQSGLGSRGTLWLVIAGVVTAAVTEEVIFRGVGITTLEKAGLPTWGAAGLSLLAFALVHVASWPLAHVMLVALPLGAALTWCYVRYRNLWVVIIAHAIVDAPLIFFSLGA